MPFDAATLLAEWRSAGMTVTLKTDGRSISLAPREKIQPEMPALIGVHRDDLTRVLRLERGGTILWDTECRGEGKGPTYDHWIAEFERLLAEYEMRCEEKDS